MSFSDRHERLRQTLRGGDPAGEETGLSAAEEQAMRRAVLSAAPERPARTFRLAPAFAAAAVAVLSALVTLDLWRAHEERREPMAVPGASAPAPETAPETAAPAPAPEAVAVTPPPAPHPRPLSHAPSRRPGEGRRHPKNFPLSRGLGGSVGEGAGGEGPAVEPAEPPAQSMRQVQFSTPGGTRIIWLLPELSEGAQK
jgi:hypothetical protein